MGLASKYTLAGSSSSKIMRAMARSFSSPRSSVFIISQYLISIGSKALWIISRFSFCSFILSARNALSPASGGSTLLTTMASTFLL